MTHTDLTVHDASRRAIVSAPAAGALSAVIARLSTGHASPAPSVDESRLVSLAERLVTDWSTMLQRLAPDEDVPDEVHIWADVVLDEMLSIPARSLGGILAKMQALTWCSDGKLCLPSENLAARLTSLSTDVLMQDSIFTDLFEMTMCDA